MLQGLNYLHSKNIVNLYLEPENILMLREDLKDIQKNIMKITNFCRASFLQ